MREGAVPQIHGLRSTAAGIEVNVAGERRHQFGAAVPYGEDTVGGDVQLRVHVSMFNNTAETILGGKTLSDEFLMKYAQVLQAQLPLPLMVHTRAHAVGDHHRPAPARWNCGCRRRTALNSSCKSKRSRSTANRTMRRQRPR